MKYQAILGMPPFGVPQSEKERLLLPYLSLLTEKHRECCPEYGRVLKILGYSREKAGKIEKLEQIPMIPVSLFKGGGLKSVPALEIFKTVQSSGTTGQKRSEIVLDRNTAADQQKTLSAVAGDFIGRGRFPLLIVDSPEVLKNRELFSARGAGILGFSIFGTERFYALNSDMSLNLDGIQEFLERHRGEPVLLFGFTFMIWKYFYQALYRGKMRLEIENGCLIHGGGWKKLKNEAVTEQEFKEALKRQTGIGRVHNYYGMAEQTGSIYMECECGHLHAASYSEVITRRSLDFSVCDIGEKGLLQVISPAAQSYPGHSLLTEDEGIILGIDDCPCKRKGKYFKVTGRTAGAEIRGCSDTYEG